MPHEYYPAGDFWDVRWLAIGGFGLKYLYNLLNLKPGVYSLWNHTGLEIQMNKMHAELTDDSYYGNLHASTHVDEFLAVFAREAGLLVHEDIKKEKKDAYSKHMKAVKDYVDCHYPNVIRMEELCELTGLTPQHLCRITRRCTGMSPTEYIIKKRIDTAKELLKSTDHTISDIAKGCGFENNNYFWKTFKAAESLTPGEYRKRYKR